MREQIVKLRAGQKALSRISCLKQMYLWLRLNLAVFVRQTQHPPEKSERTVYRSVGSTFLRPFLSKRKRIVSGRVNRQS
jgi:hypothetical protein